MKDKVIELAKNTYDMMDWKYHVIPVVKNSLKLAEIKNANREIVELAAYLHDIARADLKEHSKKDHDIRGAEIAYAFLTDLGYPEETAEKVASCIRTHRGSNRELVPETIEAKILTTADAMSHFQCFPILFLLTGEKFKDEPEKKLKWASDKIDGDWNEKIMIEEARPLVEKEYRACRFLLDSMLEYL
ncbi:MAG: HD domain-containing protein [Candidatus Aenigmatarchaeota archaeon]